ncbi:hypothetical protein D0962_23705 [Leptolyngbyaceae cyanobacterium CCMR0082]|uniref:Uncharacterized protein n=2 Tax=Adonisia turfae TaxID=2950184 RepID=A0A6M0SBM5_9CYAN|nr:hypothetical protein [Adonisia turfae]MDV3348469.1 hypothetical protein [Leptothoe sp. LEGE 181152]NEZ56491.1 hypothetical protein [Adonisia turfae CCMR0081]NEZ65726.1 hypothetical protein [Adonisia turfae CCMR0082]
MAELTGPWLGSYWQANSPTRFEATFVQANNSISGRIVDDGPLGEAQVHGQITGRYVTFTKKYFNTPSYAIQYTGTVSEDGDHINGHWRLDSKHSGEWEAHRSDNDLSKELRAILSKNAPELATTPN